MYAVPQKRVAGGICLVEPGRGSFTPGLVGGLISGRNVNTDRHTTCVYLAEIMTSGFQVGQRSDEPRHTAFKV